MIYTKQMIRDKVIFKGQATVFEIMASMGIDIFQAPSIVHMLTDLCNDGQLSKYQVNGAVIYSKGTNLPQDLLSYKGVK